VADYFVKNGGNDANTGLSDAQAWETETKVETEWQAGTFSAGDTISFNRGDTWVFTSRITLDNASAGAIGNHIVIGAYGSGADPIWDANTGHFGFLSIESNYVTVQNIEMTDWFDASGIRITLETVHHVFLDNLYMHVSTATSWTAGIRIRLSCWMIQITNCTIDDIEGEGIYLGTTSSPFPDPTRLIWIGNCTITDCHAEAMDVRADTQSVYVYNCHLEDNATDESPADDWAQITFGCRKGVIYQTRTKGTAGSNRLGVYMGRYGTTNDGGRYNTLERCLFESCTGLYGGAALQRDNNFIYNCTFVDVSHAIYCFNTGDGSHIAKNNIFSNWSEYAVNMQADENDFDFDYNDYGDGSTDVWWQGGAARNFAAVQAFGQEANGLTSAPGFAETGMYTLTDPGSANIDAGLSSVTVYDWDNEYTPSGAVDIGWRESGDWREGPGELPHRIFSSFHEDSATFGRYSGTAGGGDIIVEGNVPTPVMGKRQIKISITDATNRYAYRTGLGDLEHFFVNFYLNTDDLTMASGDVFTIFEGRTSGDAAVMRIQLHYDGANFDVRAGIKDDTDTWTYTSYYDLSGGWEYIEAFWLVAPSTTVNNGTLILWVNGIEEEYEIAQNNHDDPIDGFYIGAVDGLDVGTSGTFYIDAVTLDWIRPIGEYVSPVTYLYTTPVVVVTV
jgi:hypothetical protein